MKKVVKPDQATGQRADRRALADVDDLIDEGAYDAASVLAWEVQRASPGDPAVWLMLARIDYLRERFAAAMYAARMATRLDPASSEAWLALAMTAVTRARWRIEGLDAALQATALAPDDPRTWTVLSQLHLTGGAVYDAAVAAEQAIRVDPTDRGGHLMLGETALDAGELAHAEAAFQRVLELDSQDQDALAGLAEVLEAKGVDPTPPAVDDDEAVAPTRVERTLRRQPPPDDVPLPGRPFSNSITARLRGHRIALIVVAVSLVGGLIAGVGVPGLGVVRGLVGGVALSLMWIAVRPLRLADPPRHDAREAASSDDDDTPPGEDAPVAEDASAGGGGQRGEDTPAGEDASDGQDHAPAAEHDPPQAEGDGSPSTGRPAIDELPASPGQLAELSRQGLATSDVELAHAAASRLEAIAPGTVETHRAVAAVALAEQDYEQARFHYRRVLELEPLDEEAHQRLAVIGDEPRRAGPRFPLRGLRGRR